MYKSFVDRIARAQLRLGEPSELSQSRARILITFLSLSYLVLYYRQFAEPGGPAWYAAILACIYLAAALLWHVLLRSFPRPYPTRKVLAIASDATIISAGVYLGGPYGVALYPAYLWVIAGNGLRFGTAYLRAAVLVSVLGFSIAMLSSDYWRAYMQVGIGLLVGMLLVSALFHSLLRRLHDINQRLRERARESERQATRDPLTGLANRALFLARLEQELGALGRNQTHLGVLFIDLDGFKAINDAHGHAVGDRLLVQVAERLLNAVRRSDTVARIGGDEFAVLLCGLHAPQEARIVAGLILDTLNERYCLDSGELLAATPSIGVATAPRDGDDADTLFHNADMAMYAVKRAGKGAVREFPEIDATLLPSQGAAS